MKKYLVIIIICSLCWCLYHLNSFAPTVTQGIILLFPNFDYVNFWDSFIITAQNMAFLCALIFIKIILKILSEHVPKYIRFYKVVKTIFNIGLIPYICFKMVYDPLSYYGLIDFITPAIKKIFIYAEIGLILLGICLTIKKDNDLYLKE